MDGLIGYVIGADIGQARDPTALCVLEAATAPRIRHLERLPLGVPYPDIMRCRAGRQTS